MRVPLPMSDTWIVFGQRSVVDVQGGLRFVRLMAMTILLADLLLAGSAPAQTAPASPERPWHGSAEFNMKAYAESIAQPKFALDQSKTYSLSELIDLAEAHNPATRVAWERARSQAAGLGIGRSELYPTLAAAALSQTQSGQAFLGNRFYGQTTQAFVLALDLNYTVFDFGARSGRIDAARARLLSANFAFNDIHRTVINQVQQAYYRLLSAMGQEDAAQASLTNAKSVQQAAEERLNNGLATLPDLLEAHSATARAEYDLQAVVGAEEIAGGDLATAVGTSASIAIKVQPLDQLPTPDSIGETVEQAMNQAFADQDVVALRLAIQAGPTGPEGRVPIVANAVSKNGRYVIDVLWLCDHFWDISVRASIRRIAHQVADTMPDKILAKYLDQLSLKLFRSSPHKIFVYSIRAGGYIRTTDACGVC
jgi:hypothetical protein